MAYRNDTKGARAIHLTNGTMTLVEPGATVSVSPDKVRRLGPGIIEVQDADLPPVPEDLAEATTFDHDGDGKAGGSKKGAASTASKGSAKRKSARKPKAKR